MSLLSMLRRMVAPPVYKGLGIDIFGKLKWLDSTEEWNAAERMEWRLSKLNTLLVHCWARVPFYREYWSDHGVRPTPLRHVEELARYPLISREVFKANRDRLVPDNLAVIPHKSDSTGGTTGAPLKYFHDLDLHALRYACQIVGWGFAGYRFGDPVFVVAGGSLIAGRTTLRNRVRGWLESKRGLHCLQMDPPLAVVCAEAIQRQKAEFLVGYPSTISLLCGELRKLGIGLTGLKAVITTAEMLLPTYRATIEEFTGVPVFDHYGCNDGGLLSYECDRHAGLHYNDLESILEVENPAEDGVGELAITNLWNRSMPFVRFLNGDFLNLEANPCPCGRAFPLIGRVRGRTADILAFANGKNLTGPGVTLIFKDLPVEAWQAVQTGPNQLEIRLRASSRLLPKHEDYIRQVLGQHLGASCEISLRYPEKLTVTRGGKLKPVFAEWKLEDSNSMASPAAQ